MAFILTLAWPATAPAAAPAAEILIPSAGWQGRAIQAPHRHEVVRASSAARDLRGWSAGPVAIGAGFRRQGGSARVREVQRRLSRLGYRVGPADGLFGPRTRASIGWFQVKHGLRVTGRATLATVRHLRARTRADRRPAAAGPRDRTAAHPPAERATRAWEAFNQLVGPRTLVPDGESARGTMSPGEIALIAVAIGDLLLLLALAVQRRSVRGGVAAATATDPSPAPRPDAAEAAAPPAAAPRERRRFPPSGPPVEERPLDGRAAAHGEARR